MYQVLVSIQGMILGVTHPIYNEPGLGGFESHERPGGGDGGGDGIFHIICICKVFLTISFVGYTNKDRV